MKHITLHLFAYFFLVLAAQVFGQDRDVRYEEVLETIKTGNTLREAQQFKQAEVLLLDGLKSISGKNRYWEAAANEYLGLLYRDVGDVENAIIYFNKALDLYTELRVAASARAVADLLHGLEGKEDLYAGIEIGAKGVKLSVVGVQLNIEGMYDFRVLYNDAINPNLVRLTEESQIAAIKAINEFIKVAKEKYEIPEERIFIVGSSGVKIAAEREKMLDKLTQRLKKEVKGDYPLEFIDAEKEAHLVIQGATLRKYRGMSSTLDIGSGNTKGGIVRGVSSDLLESVSFPYGSETLVDRIKGSQLEPDINYDSAARIVGREIRKDIQLAFKNNPGLKNRQIVHLVGGVVWAMNIYLMPESINEMYVRIHPGRIRQFRYLLQHAYDTLTQPDLSQMVDERLKEKVAKEAEHARSSFSQEQLIAGATIMEEAVREYLDSPIKKRFVYARQGYIGWITGYIMEMISKEYAELKE